MLTPGITITIHYDPRTGAISCERPQDAILALGILERSKIMVAADLHGLKQSPIVGADAPLTPNLNG